MINQSEAGLASLLTERERKVLEYLLAGKTTKGTAQILGISPKTVETYRSRVRAKFRVQNTVELVASALRAGF